MKEFISVIIPLFVLAIIFYGYLKKVNVYEAFLEGASEGIKICIQILPAMLAMIFAVNLFFDSNILSIILKIFNNKIPFSSEILSMMVLRPISGNATLAIMSDILKTLGPDSFDGRLASVIQGCTDTTVYVIALYYGSIGVKKIRYTLLVGLFADFIGILAAIILTNIFF